MFFGRSAASDDLLHSGRSHCLGHGNENHSENAGFSEVDRGAVEDHSHAERGNEDLRLIYQPPPPRVVVGAAAFALHAVFLAGSIEQAEKRGARGRRHSLGPAGAERGNSRRNRFTSFIDHCILQVSVAKGWCVAMIRAVLKNGKIRPLQKLPRNWRDGQELTVESNEPSDDPEDIERWYAERQKSRGIPAADHRRLQKALAEQDRIAKEQMRREMGLD
jgi:hypothetical protein